MAEPSKTPNSLSHLGSQYPKQTMLAKGLLMFIFSALHAAAWNSHFPSGVERWLWRGFTIGMCAFPWAAAFLILTTKYHDDLFSVILESRHGKTGPWSAVSYSMKQIHKIAAKHAGKNDDNDAAIPLFVLHYFLLYFCLFLLLCYFFCAAFITVEAYISLRSPPDGSFLTPVWSDYWPDL